MNIGHVFVLLCYLLIGISYPITKVAMTEIPIWIFMAITFAIGFMMLQPAVHLVDRTDWRRIGRRNWIALAGQALLGAVLYTAFLLYGFAYATAVVAAVASSMAPAAVLLLSAMFLGERLDMRKVMAIVLAVASILVMSLPGQPAEGKSSFVGVAFLALSTLSTALGIVGAKKFATDMPPLTMAAGVCLCGLIFSLPAAVWEGWQFDWHSLHSGHWAVMAYYGTLVWAVPYLLFFLGVRLVPASSVGMAVAVVPVAATFFAIAVYGEKIRSADIVALVLVVISIIGAEAKMPARAGIKPFLRR